MTKAALTKLLLLVILAFIICLPEFFRTHTVSSVNFLCLPYQTCEQRNQVNNGDNGRPGNAQDKRKDICDHFSSPDCRTRELICIQRSQSNLTDLPAKTQGTKDDPEMSWFMCEADENMEELHRSVSASGLEMYLEFSVELHLNNTETLNLTFYGRGNHTSLHLHPPEEDQTSDGEGQREAFHCCFPPLPTSKSANQSLCLLWLANQTVLTGTAKEKLPWKRTDKGEWWSVFRVIWLALLGVVLLTVLMAVIREINWGKRLCKKSNVHPISHHFTSQHLNGEKKTDVITLKAGTRGFHQSHGLQTWSNLPTIQEVDSQSEIETLLNENTDHSYTANLHHRVHPSPAVPTEEQTW